jgi:hypothetical protein
MARLPRRASLLVAFFLLTSGATAYAECAWVLWSAPGGASLPVGAWDTKSRCEEAKNERLHALGSAVERTAVTFVCLPDTVDPRGPKGGAR